MDKQIKLFIAYFAGFEENEISLSSKLCSELKLDSLDIVTLVMELENKFQITVDDIEIDGLKTVGNVVELVKKLAA